MIELVLGVTLPPSDERGGKPSFVVGDSAKVCRKPRKGRAIMSLTPCLIITSPALCIPHIKLLKIPENVLPQLLAEMEGEVCVASRQRPKPWPL